jgi:arylsulfatase A-like enzyme
VHIDVGDEVGYHVGVKKRPNIIWIYCDELRADALGCYGNQHFRPRTPHLDRLADGGVRFENCFTNSPICVSARMAKLSARYPEETGVYANEPAFEACTYHGRHLTFPEVFAREGYATASFGKTHLPRGVHPWGVDDQTGKEAALIRDRCDPESIIEGPGPRTTIGGRYTSSDPFPPLVITENATRWMSEQTGNFLCRVSYLQPHTPVAPPPPFHMMYAAENFPKSTPRDEGQRSALEKRMGEICRAWELSPQQFFDIQSWYYGLTSWVDAEVGKLLAWLEDRDQLADTLIVFDADHGASLGEYGCVGKHLFARRTHRIPRIISWPEHVGGGQVREDICEGLDLARTLLGAAGLESPEEFRGRDLLNTSSTEAVYATIGHGLPWSVAFPYKQYGQWHGDTPWPRRSCVRTQRHRLEMTVRHDGRAVSGEAREIFLADRESDPQEINNLAEAPAHADVRDHLLALLEKHVAGSVEDACEFEVSKLN